MSERRRPGSASTHSGRTQRAKNAGIQILCKRMSHSQEYDEAKRAFDAMMTMQKIDVATIEARRGAADAALRDTEDATKQRRS